MTSAADTDEIPAGMARPARRRFLAGLLLGALAGGAAGFVGGFFLAGSLFSKLYARNEPSGQARMTGEGQDRPQPLSPPLLRRPVEPLTLGEGLPIEDLDGKPVPAAAFRGKVLVVNVWGTYCVPCLREMPALEALHLALKDDSRIAVIAVAVDEPPALRKFLARRPVSIPVFRVRQGGRIPGMGSAVPVTLIADAAGDVVARELGAKAWSSPEVLAYVRNLADAVR